MIEIVKAILSAERIVVIDTLSFCNSFHKRISIPESIDILRKKHGPSLFIFVIKKQNQTADYCYITREYKDTMIVECNDSVVISNNRKTRAEYRTDWESEADDHMTQLIERAITLTGCASLHEGFDQYRNAKDVATYIPAYPYYTYTAGVKTSAIMESTRLWVTLSVLTIMANGPRAQCTLGDVGFCSSKGHTKNPCCDICGICIQCRLKINKKRKVIVSRYLKDTRIHILEKINHSH
jgi:hypothetical protein